MQLNHPHLMVANVQTTAAFLETYFGLSCFPDGRDKFVVMSDQAGMILTLMQGKDCAYPKNFHIGFAQPNEASVDALWERMRSDGHEPSTPQRAHAWSYYVQAPGGVLIEVLC